MENYNYHVIWSKDDEEYVALCEEMPSVSFLADNPINALNGLLDVISTIINDN